MKKVKRYSDEFKKYVVLEVLSGRMSIEGIKRKYGIGGSNTVPRWLGDYERSIPKAILMSKKRKKTAEELEAELERLKHELAYEKLKSESYDRMIDIAEEEFKIPIRKKFGAKRSKK